MTMKKHSLMAAGLFVLGCATGGAASRMVNPARAQADGPASDQQRWHYRCIKQSDVASIQAEANQLGKQGWELAAAALSGTSSFADPIWCFKR
jgi:hypothetical protein